jgi:UDP-N-acetylmuramate-alanine ligase
MKSGNSIWMLGACGMGVGPLAIYLKESGNEVYGWDDSTESPMENHLANADIPLSKRSLGQRDVSLI